MVDEAGSPIAAKVGVPPYRGMTRIRDVTTDGIGTFELGPMRAGSRELRIRTKKRGSVLIDNGQIATELTFLLAELRRNIYSRLSPDQQQKLAEGGIEMRKRRAGRWQGADKEKSL